MSVLLKKSVKHKCILKVWDLVVRTRPIERHVISIIIATMFCSSVPAKPFRYTSLSSDKKDCGSGAKTSNMPTVP